MSEQRRPFTASTSHSGSLPSSSCGALVPNAGPCLHKDCQTWGSSCQQQHIYLCSFQRMEYLCWSAAINLIMLVRRCSVVASSDLRTAARQHNEIHGSNSRKDTPCKAPPEDRVPAAECCLG